MSGYHFNNYSATMNSGATVHSPTSPQKQQSVLRAKHGEDIFTARTTATTQKSELNSIKALLQTHLMGSRQSPQALHACSDVPCIAFHLFAPAGSCWVAVALVGLAQGAWGPHVAFLLELFRLWHQDLTVRHAYQ